MLWRSERGGLHATGVAVLREDGTHVIAKRPLPARRFIDHNAFFEVQAGFDNKATAIIGHNRRLQENDFKTLDVHFGINQLDNRSFTSFEKMPREIDIKITPPLITGPVEDVRGG